MNKNLVFGLDDLEKVAATLWAMRNECAVYTFTGALGAGKTTLVKELLRQAGVREVTTSPTFTYVNVYKVGDVTLYHFDLYRITSLEEFLQQGFDEYLYQPQSWSFIEWPQIIEPLLEKRVCQVALEYEGADRRVLKIQKK